MKKPALVFLALGIICFGSNAASAQGIKVKKDALEKVQWYHAPREIQILNEDPSVRDMRGGSADPGQITIPLGGGGASGPRSGAMNPNLLNGLPKATFGQSNIPAGGLPA